MAFYKLGKRIKQLDANTNEKNYYDINNIYNHLHLIVEAHLGFIIACFHTIYFFLKKKNKKNSILKIFNVRFNGKDFSILSNIKIEDKLANFNSHTLKKFKPTFFKFVLFNS